MSPSPRLRPLEVGIFARTFASSGLDTTLSSAREAGFRALHFNFACAGLPSLPTDLDPAACALIRDAFAAHGCSMVGVSATYNTIHPDRSRRHAETERAQRIIELAPTLGTTMVSLSTGTRDPDNMWRGHPGNDEPGAWRDLLDTLALLAASAQEAGVCLGIEPERNNVVSSAERARQLLDELRTPHLRIILDPANLVDPASPETQGDILSEAFELLASRTDMIHAKDVTITGHVAAGRGLLDYGRVFDLVRNHHLRCPVVIHDVAVDDVPRARAFVEGFASSIRVAVEGSG